MVLRGSPYAGESDLDHVLELATEATSDAASSYQTEFLAPVGAARQIAREMRSASNR